jgi:hypothetical protein
MFPQRAVPDIEPEPAKAGDDDDFLSRHGFKVAVLGVITAGVLIYRWVKNGSNRNDTEKSIRSSFLVDPTEIGEIRHANNITVDMYMSIAKEARREFPSGQATYSSFIRLVQRQLGSTLASGHVLDRIVLIYI